MALLCALLVSMWIFSGCSSNTGPGENVKITTLLTGLEYPKGLWIAGGKVYFTETAGRNTTYGGKVALSTYDIATGATALIIDNPANSDAVVVTASGTMYLTSWHGAIPGDFGKVSSVDPVTHVESQVTDLQIASTDMFLKANEDILVIGESNTVDANSMYLLPSGNYGNATVLHRGLGIAKCLTGAGGVIYYSDDYDVKRWVSISTLESFFPGKSVESISATSAWLYYADTERGTVARIDVGSRRVEMLADRLNGPTAIRWVDSSKKLYLLEAGTDVNHYKDGTLKVITGLR
ncbi:MAG TPA: hypothetical protein VMT60_03835 [Candidatus Bathyarchaeia archaeon]|nr:hypothetical protein [Candidatus Bathyarchaeia archaeon]